MGKKKKDTKKDSKLVRSINKNVRSSTRKLKPILKSIVGKKVDVAMRDLTFSEKRISKDVKKTISSAVANAENNYQYDIDKLIVKEAYCGKQIVMKRFRPRAKGRAAPIKKPYSNLTIILSEIKKMEKDKIPCGPIFNIKDAVENPQVKSRNMIVNTFHKVVGDFKTAGNPIKMSSYKDETKRGDIPDLDEHRKKIIEEFCN